MIFPSTKQASLPRILILFLEWSLSLVGLLAVFPFSLVDSWSPTSCSFRLKSAPIRLESKCRSELKNSLFFFSFCLKLFSFPCSEELLVYLLFTCLFYSPKIFPSHFILRSPTLSLECRYLLASDWLPVLFLLILPLGLILWRPCDLLFNFGNLFLKNSFAL